MGSSRLWRDYCIRVRDQNQDSDILELWCHSFQSRAPAFTPLQGPKNTQTPHRDVAFPHTQCVCDGMCLSPTNTPTRRRKRERGQTGRQAGGHLIILSALLFWDSVLLPWANTSNNLEQALQHTTVHVSSTTQQYPLLHLAKYLFIINLFKSSWSQRIRFTFLGCNNAFSKVNKPSLFTQCTKPKTRWNDS